MAAREVVVVTGASGGVGRAIAQEFGRHGAAVGWSLGAMLGCGRRRPTWNGSVGPLIPLSPTSPISRRSRQRRYLAKTAISGQQTPDPYDGTKAANLFAPVDDDHDEGAHGVFDAQAKGRSAQAWLTRHRTATRLASAGLLAAAGGAAAALLRRSA